jgi:electron transfer flavoprotein beta subunit
MMNMIVCCKQIADPEAPPVSFKIDPSSYKMIPPPGFPPVISPFDLNAVEAALRIKDASGGRITILSLGNNLLSDVVKKPLSMGADELVLLEDEAFEGGDSWSTAHVLAMAIKKIGAYDIIFCGRQAADWDSGQVGSGIAEILEIPSITLAKNVEIVDGTVRVVRALDDWYEVVETTLPALITVSNELGEPRYQTVDRIKIATKKQPVRWKPVDISLEPAQTGASGGCTRVLRLFQPTRETTCEIVCGDSPSELGSNLATRLKEAKVFKF